VDTHLKLYFTVRPPRFRQAGFSMVEMLMAAFILAIGVLGLSMLQVMSARSTTGSRMQTLAIGVGQNILESIDAEARQQRLFRTIDPASTAPALSNYFVTAAQPVTATYSVYGTPVNLASTDPLEKVAIFTATSTCTKDATGASAASGGVYSFVVVVNFVDGVNSSGTAATRTQTFRRKVTL
jgi:prepilin-type N-terminal cleavage/methylation domain-containing protein